MSNPVRVAAAALVAVALVVAAINGCQPETSVTNIKQKQHGQSEQLDRSDALLKAAAAQLNDLPTAVDLDLSPPKIILDSRYSSNQGDVFRHLQDQSRVARGHHQRDSRTHRQFPVSLAGSAARRHTQVLCAPGQDGRRG